MRRVGHIALGRKAKLSFTPPEVCRFSARNCFGGKRLLRRRQSGKAQLRMRIRVSLSRVRAFFSGCLRWVNNLRPVQTSDGRSLSGLSQELRWSSCQRIQKSTGPDRDFLLTSVIYSGVSRSGRVSMSHTVRTRCITRSIVGRNGVYFCSVPLFSLHEDPGVVAEILPTFSFSLRKNNLNTAIDIL